MSSKRSIWTELRRRNVVRVGVAYAVVAWLLVQAADIMLDNFGAPDWVFKSVTAVLIIGFPLALFLAWAYELTPQGMKKTADVVPEESIRKLTGRRLDFLIIGVLAVAVVYLVFDRLVPSASDEITEVPLPVEEVEIRPEPSIAVLPFADMSAGGDQAYFADGLAEEILNLLARGGALKVTARTSSFAFKGSDVPVPEIGRTLGVAHVLEGSVRKSGDQLRITAQLIEAQTGFHLWSESFDRPVQEIFAIQDEIAGAIARALQVTLTAETVGTDTLEAYDLYLQARELIHQRQSDALKQARTLIDRALALDPDYAPALAASAELWLLLAGAYGDVPRERAEAEAESLLDRALEMDADQVDAHAVMGLLYLQRNDPRQARRHLTRALEINPSHVGANNWYANSLAAEGRLDDAISVRTRFAELNPLFVTNLGNLAVSLWSAGNLEDAQVWVRRLKSEFPDQRHGYLAAADVFMAQGRLADAWTELERAAALDSTAVRGSRSNSLLHFKLGAYERGEQLDPSGYFWVVGPAARGEVELGLSRGWERLADSPDNLYVIAGLLEALSLAGRHQELLDWVEQRWGDVASLDADFPVAAGAGRYLLPVAAAQREAGRMDDFEQTLAMIGERVNYLKKHGKERDGLPFVELSFFALSGDREAVLETLAANIDNGYRDPLLTRWPAFAPWHDDPEFQAQAMRMIELINAERAKLDMAPLPNPDLD